MLLSERFALLCAMMQDALARSADRLLNCVDDAGSVVAILSGAMSLACQQVRSPLKTYAEAWICFLVTWDLQPVLYRSSLFVGGNSKMSMWG